MFDQSDVPHSDTEGSLREALRIVRALLSEASVADLFKGFRDVAAAEAILSDWMANGIDGSGIEIVDAAGVGRTDGAYDPVSDRIMLSDALVSSATVLRIADVVAEEPGHRIDARTGAADTPGDEGPTFAAAPRGEPVQSASGAVDASGAIENAVSVSDSDGFEGSNQTITLGPVDIRDSICVCSLIQASETGGWNGRG